MSETAQNKSERNLDVVELGPANRAVSASFQTRVRGMPAKVKKITTTDEGKLQVVLESEGMDDDAMDQVKDMLTLQQSCPVLVSMEPSQRDLFAS